MCLWAVVLNMIIRKKLDLILAEVIVEKTKAAFDQVLGMFNKGLAKKKRRCLGQERDVILDE